MAKKSSKKSKRLGIVVGLLAGLVLVLIVILLVSILKMNKNKENAESIVNDKASQPEIVEEAETDIQTVVHSSEYKIVPNEYGKPVALIDVDFEKLKSNNPDTIAWIYIPNTDINCAIVRNPDDPNKYLTNDIEGVTGVFMQNYNSDDFTDSMTVVYGKKQAGKSQFEDLLEYKDKGFYEDHQYIFVSNGSSIFTYKIFAAHKAYAEHLMLGYDWSEEAIFIDYLQRVLKGDDIDPIANINSDAVISGSDRVITLSERIEGEDDYRYLVQGVLINEDIKETP